MVSPVSSSGELLETATSTSQYSLDSSNSASFASISTTSGCASRPRQRDAAPGGSWAWRPDDPVLLPEEDLY